MSSNGVNVVEDAGAADVSASDGDNVVTMMDVLQEQQDFENDAAAVLGASDDKNCTYSKGYIKRQAIYACLTCCPEAKEDPSKRAGVCLACSLNCHENHDLIELYTKRNFRCDCGNPKFNNRHCQFTPNKNDLNYENKYNQNFSGVYCTCHRPYPDPDATEEEEMIQCIICEDWLHEKHLEATVPDYDQYAEMICKDCMEDNDFLHDYSELVVNTIDKEIIVTDPDLDVDFTSIIKKDENKELTKTVNGTVGDEENKQNDIDSKADDTSNIETTSKDSDKKNEQNESAEQSEINKTEESTDNTQVNGETTEDTPSKSESNETTEKPEDEKAEANLENDADCVEKTQKTKLLQDDADSADIKKTETEQNNASSTSDEPIPDTENQTDTAVEPDSTDKNGKEEEPLKPDCETVAEKCNEVSNDVEMKELPNADASSDKDIKRKHSSDEEQNDSVAKKSKIDSKPCVRPRGVKRVYKGATFWPSNLRQKLCTCSECIAMYKDLAVLFLIDPEDTVTAYEALGKEIAEGPSSQYEKGLQALSSLDRVQQINALTEYNKMKDKLLDFLKSFKERKEIVKEEDIKAFFAGMKPKREPDGVYFCR